MKKILPIFHFMLILLAWSSPFWLNWQLILLIYILYLLQNWVFGRCLISIAQLGNTKESFYSHYLHKLNIGWATTKINFVVFECGRSRGQPKANT